MSKILLIVINMEHYHQEEDILQAENNRHTKIIFTCVQQGNDFLIMHNKIYSWQQYLQEKKRRNQREEEGNKHVTVNVLPVWKVKLAFGILQRIFRF